MPQPQDSTEFFERVAPKWNDMATQMFGPGLLEAILKALDARAGQTALDVGAGTGFVAQGLLDAKLRVTAMDASSEMRRQLADRFGKTVEIVDGDAEAPPFEADSLDRIAGNMVLHHTEDPARAICALACALKPGGVLVLSDMDTHTNKHLQQEHHDKWPGFDRTDIHNWFEAAGLTDVQVTTAPQPCTSTLAKTGQAVSISIFIASGRKAYRDCPDSSCYDSDSSDGSGGHQLVE